MKKAAILLTFCICLLLTGCSNSFAKRDYDSKEKIVADTDRYAKKNSVFNPIEGGYSLVVHEFDGRETLWKKFFDEVKDIEIEVHLSISEGSAKVVHVDGDGNVSTITECTPETAMEADITQTLSLTGGRNRIKIVGKGCVDLDVEILSPDF